MIIVKGIYDGNIITLTDPVPTTERCEVLVTFSKEPLKQTINRAMSENEKELSEIPNEKRREAFEKFMLFKGTLKREIDCEKELQEYLEERYDRIN
ncbi:MAG: hypothetical protein LBJ67_03065 [Planctomycetaceae bacterium]|jgi:hypothetical protein|nr:hypothetical protein [Planctomycetaceae bacterium]